MSRKRNAGGSGACGGCGGGFCFNFALASGCKVRSKILLLVHFSCVNLVC